MPYKRDNPKRINKSFVIPFMNTEKVLLMVKHVVSVETTPFASVFMNKSQLGPESQNHTSNPNEKYCQNLSDHNPENQNRKK